MKQKDEHVNNKAAWGARDTCSKTIFLSKLWLVHVLSISSKARGVHALTRTVIIGCSRV